MKYDVIIVGAGLAGSVIAERCANVLGWKVLVVERRDHIGGNCYDHYDENGVLVHKYGPHLFHTNLNRVVKYLSQFTEWRSYEHRVLSCVDGKLYPFPVNHDTLRTFDGDVLEKFYMSYTRKQWGCDPKEMDASVIGRVPMRKNRDDRYFTDKFQAMPIDGYTEMFKRMLENPKITVSLRNNFEWWFSCECRCIVYSGCVDSFFGCRFGSLPYRSRRFESFSAAVPFLLPRMVINYPGTEPFIRKTEFKHATGQVHPRTTIMTEYPCNYGEPFYPVPTSDNHAIYEKYADLARKLEGIHFVGRLATYRYLNMDKVVENALDEFECIRRSKNRKIQKWSMTF
jgi:UDP-galactopyranose mutase